MKRDKGAKMQSLRFKKFTSCKKFKHLFLFFILISAQTFGNGRFPSSTVPQDNFDSLPLGTIESWYDKTMVEDRKGVMVTTRDNLTSWRETEEFRETWGINFSGLYITPDREYQRSYVQKQALRYLDKRLTGELKHAKEGSALHKVNAVQQALKPDTEATITKNIKVRFKARVLQGEGIVNVENPWVDCNARVRLNGNMEVHIGRRFASLGVNTAIDYRKHENLYITSIDRALSETVTARITSTQSDSEAPFTGNADARFGLYYSKPF